MQAQSSPYFFKDFRPAIVQDKENRQFSVKVNYNLITSKWMFEDNTDYNVHKEFADIDAILFIKADTTVFIPQGNRLIELVQSDPYFTVEYQASTLDSAKPLSYGGTTQTAAVDVGLSEGGMLSNMQQNISRDVVKIRNRYEVKIGNRVRHFSSEKEFIKMFDKVYRNDIKNIIDSQKTDFSNVHQVLLLYKCCLEKKKNKKS